MRTEQAEQSTVGQLTEKPAEPDESKRSFTDHRTDSTLYSFFLTVWGFEWMLSSGIAIFGQWRNVEPIQHVFLWIAVILTFLPLLWKIRRPVGWHDISGKPNKILIPVMIMVGMIAMLSWNGVISLFFLPLMKGIVLSVGYAWLSLSLGRHLLVMSVWMFALTITIAIWYLGYASLLLGGFGGLSMVALAWMIRLRIYKGEGIQ